MAIGTDRQQELRAKLDVGASIAGFWLCKNTSGMLFTVAAPSAPSTSSNLKIDPKRTLTKW